MAKCDIYTSDLDGLWELSFDDIAEEALNESVPLLEETMKSAASASVMHPGESDMVNSIKGTKPKKSAATDCWIVNVGPRGYGTTKYTAKDSRGKKTTRKYKVSNALKAIWKEYGIPARGISARPFMDKAANAARPRVEKIIEDSFNKKVEKYEL